MPTVPTERPPESALFAGLDREGEAPAASPSPAAPAIQPLDPLTGLQREGEGLRDALLASGDQGADGLARVRKAARAADLPPQVVAGNPKLESLADAPAADWSLVEKRSPVMARRLAGDARALAEGLAERVKALAERAEAGSRVVAQGQATAARLAELRDAFGPPSPPAQDHRA